MGSTCSQVRCTRAMSMVCISSPEGEGGQDVLEGAGTRYWRGAPLSLPPTARTLVAVLTPTSPRDDPGITRKSPGAREPSVTPGASLERDLRLLTFGGLSVHGRSGPLSGSAAQPRRLAVL